MGQMSGNNPPAPKHMVVADEYESQITSNVTPIFEGSVVLVPSKPVASVVEMLRHMLELAERGEIVALAVATVSPTRNISTQWTDPGSFRHEIAASVMTLNARVGRAMCDEE